MLAGVLVSVGLESEHLLNANSKQKKGVWLSEPRAN